MNQSATTGLCSIIGAVLSAYAIQHGVPITPDAAAQLIAPAAGVGAAVVGGIAHLIVGALQKRAAATVLPPPETQK